VSKNRMIEFAVGEVEKEVIVDKKLKKIEKKEDKEEEELTEFMSGQEDNPPVATKEEIHKLNKE